MPTAIDSLSEASLVNYVSLYTGSTIGTGQAFTGNGKPVIGGAFYLRKAGSPTGSLYFKLYAITDTYGTNAKPTGSALVTATTIIDVASLTTSGVLYEFIFPTQYLTVDTTNYFISVEFSSISSNASNRVEVGYGSGHDGNYATLTGVTWTGGGTDVIFYVYSGVAIRAVGTPVTASTGAVTPTIPAGVQVGDLMVALVYSYMSSATFTCSAGWDERYEVDSYYGSYVIYTRVYVASDTNPVITPSLNDSIIGVVFALYNCDISTIFDVTCQSSFFNAPSTPFNVTISTFNTVTDGALAFFLWGSRDDNLWVYQSGGGAQQVSKDETAGTDAALCIATKSMPSYGAVGDQVARQTNKAGDVGRALWFAIKPTVAALFVSGGTLANIIII